MSWIIHNPGFNQQAIGYAQQQASLSYHYIESAPDSPKEGQKYGCMAVSGSSWSVRWYEEEKDALEDARKRSEAGKIAQVIKRVAETHPASKVVKL